MGETIENMDKEIELEERTINFLADKTGIPKKVPNNCENQN